MPPEFVEHYRNAARREVRQLAVGQLDLKTVIQLAADCAVEADRARMGEQIRNRIIASKVPDLPEQFQMQVEQMLFSLADDIRDGLPLRVGEIPNP
jgi:hypothetical protein